MYTVKVLGIPLHGGEMKDVISVFQNQKDRKNECVSATGAHGLVYSKKKPEFKKILNSFSINMPDGMPGVWMGKLKGAKKMERCYGPDFFESMMKASSGTSLTHFLCGGKEGVADELKLVCEGTFGATIKGTYCPPFLPVEAYNYQEIAKEINGSSAEVVWIGLSSPKQEQFAYHLAEYTNVKYIVCVGAAFDFHIGNVKQAPSWVQKIGMEWFFRLLMEPKRLWKRYFEIVPLFIYYNFAELLSRKFYKN